MMINFLRKKRRKLADQNSFITYSRYAIGEIILVVIGILIALQINSWNQERLGKIEERRILKNLHEEFQLNLSLLDTCILTNQNAFYSTRKIMDLIGTEPEHLKGINLDQILFNCFEHGNYFPSQHSVNELIQSGKMQFLTNDRLKVLLYQWTSNLENSMERYLDVDKKVDNDILPYLSLRYPLKDMDLYGPLKWKEPSRLPSDKLLILNQLEFENLLDDNMYRQNGLIESLKVLKILITDILVETSEYE